ncbi:MAG TPA: hypothetical protein VFU02_07060 [Polyangiaceae bacterium]|nr:hypothetical protein [Polyangiaceae bacterium]
MTQASNKPRILRITRPYESVEDYIQSEGWTISNKRMILLDQPRFERDTIVRFELSLQNGEKLIRAEAKVVGYQTPTPDKPGGPKVRFKRFGGTTKTFIQQVVAEHGPGPGLETLYPTSRGSDPGDGPTSEAPHSLNFAFSTEASGAGGRPSSPVAELQGGGRSARGSSLGGLSNSLPADLQQLQLDGMPVAPVSVRSPGVRSNPATLGAPARERLQGLLDRSGGCAVATPVDREALLTRLRERARASRPAPALANTSEHPNASPS